MTASRTSLFVGIALAIVGCGAREAEIEGLRSEVLETYASIVYASYEDSFLAAQALQEAIEDLVADPSAATLQQARTAWLAAREPYGQTEAYRFYGGPIDAVGGPEPLMNAWPLDEAYVDYVQGAPESGIINRPEDHPVLDRALLVSLNESGSEENISTGFHAIEFLLWGQDLAADGPGDRKYTDYVPGAAPNAERRASYLSIATQLLVEQLGGLVEDWAPDRPDNYRAELARIPSGEGTRRILVGIGVLSKSELAGQRMFTPYDNQNQEDEHSCFSDNTHRDILANARAITNVLSGTYRRTDGRLVTGPGVALLIDRAGPALGEEVRTLADRSVEAVEAIPVPFDRAIVEPTSRPAVLEAVYLLQDLGDLIARVGTVMGVTINTALPG